MTDFRYETDDEGVATILWDVAGRSMNVMSLVGYADLEVAIETALSDPAVRGIVLTSGKPDFAGGMDLAVLAGMKSAALDAPAREIFNGLMRVHHLLRRIELAGMDPKTKTGGKPIAAALPGTALGIGLELALACHRIFAADRPEARIGLPEIRVGLFPGAGGTTRLCRKLGLMPAAPVLLEGKLMPPRAALAMGLIDEVVAPGDLLARAREWVLSASAEELVKPWDRRGWKMPGGTPYSAEGFLTFVGASAMVTGRTLGLYPAAEAMLGAIYEGAQVDFDTALRIEARHFTSVLLDPVAEAMIRTLFVGKQEMDKGAARPGLPPAPVRHLGVIGAGMMGAAIAHVAARAGIEVTLVDTSLDAAERGRSHAETALARDAASGRLTEAERAAILARIRPADQVAALGDCDLVIEAVFEDPKVKAGVSRSLAGLLAPGAILATNTSTLPVSDLARAAERPADYIGIHFFSPVEKMDLVEIIRGAETAEPAIAKAVDFVRQLRKTPVVVGDARFFYANRCIIPYMNEGLRMLAEGVQPALIENAARQAGMPVGPLQLIDEVSLELGARIARATRAADETATASEADTILFEMVEAGRLGRKAGRGFYDYDAAGKRTGLWPGLAADYPATEDQPRPETLGARFLFVQALEAVRALEEGVLAEARDGDVAAVLGWGFAPWSGGPFSWLDRLGAPTALATCEALALEHGPRFSPPQALRDMAARDGSFRSA